MLIPVFKKNGQLKTLAQFKKETARQILFIKTALVILTLLAVIIIIPIALDRQQAHTCATHAHYLTQLPDYYLTPAQFDQCIALLPHAEDDFTMCHGNLYLAHADDSTAFYCPN